MLGIEDKHVDVREVSSDTAKLFVELYTKVKKQKWPFWGNRTKSINGYRTQTIHMYPFNNGYIEGVNNTIKVAKRMSYGIKNFNRLKKKILWRQEVRKVLAQ
ncbi:transposase [Virgibacillus halodenitrificans]|uniref:transposase n=1 Tax=Virgibacillus halodenitrificans TaxID=1482 RepID=UPI001F3BFB9D|nr:transposase [Virgibacillus halodenitrificans]MCG1027073.1 transposase [Virgibacillus halodenitrificans]